MVQHVDFAVPTGCLHLLCSYLSQHQVALSSNVTRIAVEGRCHGM